MQPKQGLVDALNAMREVTVKNNGIYHQYVPFLTTESDISELSRPILTMTPVMNEFMNVLINRIVFTQFEARQFRNPLRVLEGEELPVGYAGQSIYVDPAKGRRFNVNDFVGLLQKYEAKVKVQYLELNEDLQYPVSVANTTLKKAFTSWANLDSFIDQLTNSLYNGAFIDEYRLTKNLVTAAYHYNRAPIQVIDEPSTEAAAKAFITQARALYLNFRSPSTAYNGWGLVGDGDQITTWTDPEDIVFIIRNDIAAYIDVNVLAESFHIDRATLLGNIIYVDNFDAYDRDGNVLVDGSNIYGIMADKRWFRIQQQDIALDTFYNANNRVWNYYLNVVRMYQQSLFANGVIFASDKPNIAATALEFTTDSLSVVAGDTMSATVNPTPLNATAPVTYTSASDTVATVAASPSNDRVALITGVAAGSTTITAKSGTVTTTLDVTVTAPATQVQAAKTTKTSTAKA